MDQPAVVTTVAAPEASTVIPVAPAAGVMTVIPVAPAIAGGMADAGLADAVPTEASLADAGLTEADPTAAVPTEAGLAVVAEARWPESDHDQTPPPLPGFIVSSFSPVAAEAAARCLSRRPIGSDLGAAPAPLGAAPPPVGATPAPVVADIAEAVVRSAGILPATATAIIIASARGDVASAAHVAEAVDTAAPLGPLLFFQSVPNAVAGHIAARWNLTGPVVCVADRASALEAAALLIEDGDADSALVLHAEQDRAHAVLLRAPSSGGRA